MDAPELPIITTIPGRDRAFRRVVSRLVGQVTTRSPHELTRRLQSLYPRVAVFRRQLSGEADQLYAYRDGRFVRDGNDRWWEQEGTPCVCLSADTGRLTHVSDEWAELMLGYPGDLVGRHFSDFVLPEARDAADAMFEALAERGEVRSEALVLRSDGTTLAIEFRALRRDGEIDVRYRPLTSERAARIPT